MISLVSLWLPILLSAVAAFIASAVIHMVLKYHNSDYSKMPGEDNVLAAIGAENVAPGHYTMPHCLDPKELANEDVKAKFVKGPVAFVTVLPSGVPAMGRSQRNTFTLPSHLSG